MQIDQLLGREGLARDVRALVGVAANTWRADWPMLNGWLEAARSRKHDRAGVEETLLMCVLFCGFPRVITAWEHLEQVWPAATPPRGGALDGAEQAEAGRALFAAIYGKNDQPVRDMLRGYHEELHDFVLEAAYGRILTRPGLSAATREVIAVSVLAAQAQERQLAGHARGARRLGATRAELREAVFTALGGDPARADALVDVALGGDGSPPGGPASGTE
jgi:AhpD family alkylhydroperoxidase